MTHPLMWYAYSCFVTTHMTGSLHVYILGWLRPLMLRLSPLFPCVRYTGSPSELPPVLSHFFAFSHN